MNTREKEPVYQQPDPSVVHQHSEQGAMYADVIDPPAIVNPNFEYAIPQGGDEATEDLTRRH